MPSSNYPSGVAVGFGVELTPDRPVETTAELAAVAESNGLDTAFVSNHFDNRDPFQTLATIARRTERIGLGPGVVNPVETHPVRLATQTATVAEAAPRRVICGLGAGDAATLGKLGLTVDHPVGRVARAVEIVRGLTAGATVESDGVYELDGVSLSFSPDDPVPVYVGAQGPTMLRMAGELADGVLVNAAHPWDYQAAAEAIDAGRARRSAERGSLDVVGFACVSVAGSVEAARDAARPPVAFVTGGASGRVLERHGIDRDRAAEVRRLLRTGKHAAAYDAITPPMIDAFCVAGTVEPVTERLRSVADHVDGIVAGAPLGPDRHRAIELLGTVASALREDPVIHR